jgi:hypothetical protein
MALPKPCLGSNPENALIAGQNLSHTIVKSAAAAIADSIYGQAGYRLIPCS